jgi:hypothetical protein
VARGWGSASGGFSRVSRHGEKRARYFDSKSEVLARAFSNLIEEIYSEIPRDYTYFKETSRGKEIYHKPRVYSKRITYDLEALRIKGPRPSSIHL